MTEARREAFWKRVFEAAEQEVFVAEAGGNVVGFTSGGPILDPVYDYDAELLTLYVLPQAGVGRRARTQPLARFL